LFFCFTSRHPSAKRICDGGKDTEIIKPKLLGSNKASTNKIKHFGLGSESLSPVHSKPPTKAKCERFIIVATQKCGKAWGTVAHTANAWKLGAEQCPFENRKQSPADRIKWLMMDACVMHVREAGKDASTTLHHRKSTRHRIGG
jgi:hypothetical protein